MTLCFVLMISLVAIDMTAQIKTPAPSPSSTLMQTVGLTDFTLEYSRPSVKGRTIFGDMLAYGEVWRAGANQATKLTVSDDIMVNGQALKAGTYAILMVPGMESFEVMFFTHESTSWSSYTDKVPALKVMAKVTKLPMSIETLLYNFESLRDESAILEMVWEKTAISLDLKVEADSKVMAAIEKTLAGPTGGDYYTAGQYYHTSGKDLNKALEMVRKATNVEKPKFWQVRREALILADLGRYKEAIEVATKSKELAQAANYAEYVKNNEASIKEWMMKMK